jgi:hypothetical protein
MKISKCEKCIFCREVQVVGDKAKEAERLRWVHWCSSPGADQLCRSVKESQCSYKV